jgi:hypothetical protein
MNRGLPWAATSMPMLRRHWCNAINTRIAHHSSMLQRPPSEAAAAHKESFERLQSKVSDAIAHTTSEVEALHDARMYWVARDMVQLAVAAGADLPAWTPGEALPSPKGFLCWAKPAGLVPYAPDSRATMDATWDAVWWWTRPDGILQLQLASRFKNCPGLPAIGGVQTPLWATKSIFLDPRHPRTEEANGSEEMHPFISVVGAAWLLMGQPNFSRTRVTEPADVPAPKFSQDSATVPATQREPSSVTIVELRREVSNYDRSSAGKTTRQFRGRWMVGWPNGYWRQQAYGPGRSLRKPVLIAPHTAGPPGAPLIPPKQKVYVWRR